MNAKNRLLRVKLRKKEWYSLGYCHTYPIHRYVKDIHGCGRKSGALVASLNEKTGEMSFHATYKKQFKPEECDAMIILAFEFFDIVKENYKE